MTTENTEVVVSNCSEHKRTDDIPVGETTYGSCILIRMLREIHSPIVRKDPKSKKLICHAFSCPARTNPNSL